MGSVIKANQVKDVARRLSTISLADHVAEARALLEHARSEAGRIVEQARVDADQLREETQRAASERGYQEGLKAGRVAGAEDARREAMDEFRRQHGDAVAMLKGVVEGLEAQREAWALTAETNLLEFSLQLARRLTFAIGRLHREAAVENLRRALAHVHGKTDLLIKAHPADVDTLTTFAPELTSRLGDSPVARIVADDTIAPGGCRIESISTCVDATLETQTGEMVRLLLGEGAGDA